MLIHIVYVLSRSKGSILFLGTGGTCSHAQIRVDDTSSNYWELRLVWEGCSTAKPLNSYNSSVGVVSSSYNGHYLLTSASLDYVYTAQYYTLC
jgi:hypothetical protein